MRTIASILTIGASSLTMAAFAYAAEMPNWAYPLNPPAAAGAAPPKDDGSPQHVPGSTVVLTRTQIAGRDGVPDWHPGDHPQMPARYDIQNGTRSGSAALMKQVVAKLDNDDMIAIVAYVASRQP